MLASHYNTEIGWSNLNKCEPDCSSQKLILTELAEITGKRMVSWPVAWVQVLFGVICILLFGKPFCSAFSTQE